MSAEPITVEQSGRSAEVSPVDDVMLKRQYVIARPDTLSMLLTTLTQNIDEVTRVRGLRIYDEMTADPDVGAAYWFLVHSVTADALQISSCIKKESDDGYEQAKDISDFCNRCIKNLKGFKSIIEDMLEAIKYGHKVAEIILKDDTFNGKRVLMLDKLQVLPILATAFVVDPYMNVLGLIARRTITGPVPMGTIIDPKIVIPRDKFCVLTVRAKDADPRGQSFLRAAFNGFNFKRQVWPEFLLFLINVAVPSLIGITKQGAQTEQRRDEMGRPITDSQGNPLLATAEELMAAQLAQVRNAYTAAFPNGSDVKILESKSNGEPFHKAIQISGEEITKALLLQVLATREGQHQTRASTQSQMTVVDILVWALKGLVVNMLVDDLFRVLITVNFGEDAARDYMPDVTLGDYERRNWARDATAMAAVLPFCTYSQAEDLKQSTGIPESDEGDTEYIGVPGPLNPVGVPEEEKVPPPVVPGRIPPTVEPPVLVQPPKAKKLPPQVEEAA